MAKASLEERERMQREAEEKLFREARERRERELRLEEEERVRKQKELEKAQAAPPIPDIRSTFETRRPKLERAVTLSTSSHAAEAQSTCPPILFHSSTPAVLGFSCASLDSLHVICLLHTITTLTAAHVHNLEMIDSGKLASIRSMFGPTLKKSKKERSMTPPNLNPEPPPPPRPPPFLFPHRFLFPSKEISM